MTNKELLERLVLKIRLATHNDIEQVENLITRVGRRLDKTTIMPFLAIRMASTGSDEEVRGLRLIQRLWLQDTA